MADNDKPKTKVTRALTFNTPDGKAPGGIDIAAILKKRAERAVEEDRRRGEGPVAHRRARRQTGGQ